MLIFHCFLLLSSISHAYSANILVFNPIFGYSHLKFVSKLSDVMADAGHQVTVLQPFHLDMKNIEGLIKNKNIEIINYYPDNFEELAKQETMTFPMFWDSELMANPLLEAVFLPFVMGGLFNNTASKLMTDTELHEVLKQRNFDALVYEPFDMTGLYLADILGVPTIPALSVVRFEVIESLFGNPPPLGYVPQDHSKRAPFAGVFDRVNDIFRMKMRNIEMSLIYRRQIKFIEEAMGKKLPDWRARLVDTPLLFLNANPYLDFAVPSTDNIVKIGGVTMDKVDKVQRVPKEYDDILNEREHTVLISFGSVVRSYEMPDNFKSGIIGMFENLPNITFIWKYEREDVEFQKRLPENVKLRKWVPQPALLGDRRLSAFVTHGGLGSTMELAHTGRPALVIPIFGDQYHNAAMLERHGGVISYNKYDLVDSDKLTEAIRDLVFNSKYEDNAQMLLEVLGNQPNDPKEEFLKKLSFALKFPKYRSLQPEISHLGFIEYYFIDAFAFCFIICIISIYLSFKLSVFLIRKVFKRKQKRE